MILFNIAATSCVRFQFYYLGVIESMTAMLLTDALLLFAYYVVNRKKNSWFEISLPFSSSVCTYISCDKLQISNINIIQKIGLALDIAQNFGSPDLYFQCFFIFFKIVRIGLDLDVSQNYIFITQFPIRATCGFCAINCVYVSSVCICIVICIVRFVIFMLQTKHIWT